MTSIETKTAFLTLVKENFVRMEMKENAFLELEDMKENHEAEQRITNGKPHVILIDTRKNSMSSDEARKFSSRDEARKYRHAVAVLFSGLAGRIIANSLLKKYTPKARTSIFNNEAEAIQWLEDALTSLNQSSPDNL